MQELLAKNKGLAIVNYPSAGLLVRMAVERGGWWLVSLNIIPKQLGVIPSYEGCLFCCKNAKAGLFIRPALGKYMFLKLRLILQS